MAEGCRDMEETKNPKIMKHREFSAVVYYISLANY